MVSKTLLLEKEYLLTFLCVLKVLMFHFSRVSPSFTGVELKRGLKLNIQKTKIMASGLITSWQTGGETMETVTDFIFLGSKITANCDCSHEIRRCYASMLLEKL